MKPAEAQQRMAHHVETALGQALGALTGTEFTVGLQDRQSDLDPPPEAIIWQQTFSNVSGPSLWLVAGRDLWESLSTLTLEAAGIDPVTEADCRSTWQEIVNQTASGVASGVTADLSREVSASRGEELDREPGGLNWSIFAITDGTGKRWLFKAAWSPELLGAEIAAATERRVDERRADTGRESMSKTFDLLLDVPLPVSVSFGRTHLQIREVLKLNTGSIVELDRFISDPVEVIVNDCVIARGEVVVVDGNYGVRISHLASREDRLRSGMGDAKGRNGLRP